MKLVFRCHPAHRDVLPPPVPARAALPEWVRTMPARALSDIAGAQVRTVKQCPPFVDALRTGVLLPLVADLKIADGAMSWQSDLPIVDGTPIGRSPIGVHVPEQLTGVPFAPADRFLIKFMNYWAIEAPPGFDVWFTHPANRLDLPFRTLTGRVSCDAFRLGLVHFPALWIDAAFTGTLPKGTPVAQCFAVARGDVEVELDVLSEAELAEQHALREALANTPGTYRKAFHRADSPLAADDAW